MTTQGYIEWDEEMFSRDDLHGLLTADLVHRTVLFSIDHILRSVARDRLGNTSQIDTEFLLNINCPTEKDYQIFKYKIAYGGPNGIDIVSTKIEKNDIGMIGMSDVFYDRAKEIYLNCLNQERNPTPELLDFMKNAINEVHAEGGFEIDYPIIVKSIGRFGIGKPTVHGQVAETSDNDI